MKFSDFAVQVFRSLLVVGIFSQSINAVNLGETKYVSSTVEGDYGAKLDLIQTHGGGVAEETGAALTPFDVESTHADNELERASAALIPYGDERTSMKSHLDVAEMNADELKVSSNTQSNDKIPTFIQTIANTADGVISNASNDRRLSSSPYLPHWEFVLAPNLDLYGIKKSGTGTGTTELHVLTSLSNYKQFSLQIPSALHETGDNWEFLLAPNLDLYCICKRGTGTGTTEIHVLSSSSNYKQFSLQIPTALHETGDNWEFQLAPNLDLYCICKRGTGTGTTELHVLSSSSNYEQFILQIPTALHETGDNWEFQLASNLDLYCICKSGTGTGTTEIHVLSSSSSYKQFILQIPTALHETDNDWEFLLAPNLDLYSISRETGTGTGSTEIYVLSRSNGYEKIVETRTALEETPKYPHCNWQCLRNRYPDYNSQIGDTDMSARDFYIREGYGGSWDCTCDFPECNWIQYLDRYDDLRQAGILTGVAASQHYRDHGEKEGRDCTDDPNIPSPIYSAAPSANVVDVPSTNAPTPGLMPESKPVPPETTPEAALSALLVLMLLLLLLFVVLTYIFIQHRCKQYRKRKTLLNKFGDSCLEEGQNEASNSDPIATGKFVMNKDNEKQNPQITDKLDLPVAAAVLSN